MKKSYLISFFVCIVMVSMIYSIFYTFTVNNSEDKNSEISKNTEESAVKADNSKKETVTNNTEYILEYYNEKDDTIVEKTLPIPVDFLGMTRSEIIDYLEKYEEAPDYQDIELGLTGYKLVSFSKDRIVLRKSYITPEISYKYCLVDEDGYVTVYYTDLRTVYSHTTIEVAKLPDKVQKEIRKVKYVENVEELYDFLENYSS